jgi:hypothetical protein
MPNMTLVRRRGWVFRAAKVLTRQGIKLIPCEKSRQPREGVSFRYVLRLLLKATGANSPRRRGIVAGILPDVGRWTRSRCAPCIAAGPPSKSTQTRAQKVELASQTSPHRVFVGGGSLSPCRRETLFLSKESTLTRQTPSGGCFA